MRSKQKNSAAPGIKIVSENRAARFNYHLIEFFEAGVVLLGTEVKSVKNGGLSLAESYVRPEQNAVWLLGAYIRPYEHSDNQKYEPTRGRKLLLKKHEISELCSKVNKKGLTIVPTKAYLKSGLCKIEIALAKGKDTVDKRHTVKERQAQKAIRRSLSVV